MKCDFCKKRLYHPKIVHSSAGAFHAECLDKLHATAEGLGQFIFAFMQWDKKGRPSGGEEGLVRSMQNMAGPLSVYTKQLAENIRKKNKKTSRE